MIKACDLCTNVSVYGCIFKGEGSPHSYVVFLHECVIKLSPGQLIGAPFSETVIKAENRVFPQRAVVLGTEGGFLTLALSP